jgi:O-antigen ligase
MITKNLAIILRGYISKRLLKIVSISMIVLVIVFPLVPNVLDLIGVILDLQVLERRLEGESGLASRLGAWKQLWPYFTEAPLTGKAGWWNSTNLLPESGTPGTAASPHNLYVRLLSESGLAGFIAVLALPVLSGLACLKRVLSTEVESKRFRIASFMTGSIMSILIGQMFEDRYLVGIAGIGNGIITFIIVSAIITCSKS